MTLEEYPAKLTTGYYRVRETWDEPASQIGAYRLLKSAMTTCDANPGTFVFDNDGNAIYPEVEEAPVEEVPVEEESPVEKTDPVEEETPDGETEAVEEESPVEENKPAEDTDVAEPAEPEKNDASGEAVSDTIETNPMDEEPEGKPDGEEFPDAIPPEEKAPDEESDAEDNPEAPAYENDGSEEVVGYAKLKTLMNIRHGNALDAPWLTTYKKGTIVEVLQVCENDWLRIRCRNSDAGFAYVSAADAHFTYGVGKKLYTVKHKDNLWKISEEQLGTGLRYTDIRAVNGLTCNVIRVGMVLIMP